MDSSSTILGIIVIIACVSPFLLLNYNRKKNKTNLLKKIELSANSQGDKISNSEACGDYAIGLDEAKKVLYFIKKTMTEQIPKRINLDMFKACKLVHNSSSVDGKGGSYKVINLLELRLLPIEQGKNETSLELYNVNINSQLSGELQSAENWVQKLNQFMK